MNSFEKWLADMKFEEDMTKPTHSKSEYKRLKALGADVSTPELSLNERLAIAFGHADTKDNSGKLINACGLERYWRAEVAFWDRYPSDYENDSVAAVALLEKAKKDGKIFGYGITSIQDQHCVRLFLTIDENFAVDLNGPLSKAITQALAQLIK